MRTTITLDKDTIAAVRRLQRDEGLGLSEAVNRLVRAGLTERPVRRRPFRQRTARVGLRMDVTNVADALEALDGPDAR